MNRLFAALKLTVPEQRAVIVVFSILIVVAAAKNYPVEKLAPVRPAVQPSPSPGIRP